MFYILHKLYNNKVSSSQYPSIFKEWTSVQLWVPPFVTVRKFPKISRVSLYSIPVGWEKYFVYTEADYLIKVEFPSILNFFSLKVLYQLSVRNTESLKV